MQHKSFNHRGKFHLLFHLKMTVFQQKQSNKVMLAALYIALFAIKLTQH